MFPRRAWYGTSTNGALAPITCFELDSTLCPPDRPQEDLLLGKLDPTICLHETL